MRRYDDLVEVRRGAVGDTVLGAEAPAQFLWRGRLWKVRVVLARWVETGAWWHSTQAQAVLGTDDGAVRGRAAGATSDEESVLPVGASFDLLGEREMWRVEAGRGAVRSCDETGDSGDLGVFELSFDTSDGRWLLVGCDD